MMAHQGVGATCPASLWDKCYFPRQDSCDLLSVPTDLSMCKSPPTIDHPLNKARAEALGSCWTHSLQSRPARLWWEMIFKHEESPFTKSKRSSDLRQQ